MLNLQLRTVL